MAFLSFEYNWTIINNNGYLLMAYCIDWYDIWDNIRHFLSINLELFSVKANCKYNNGNDC